MVAWALPKLAVPIIFGFDGGQMVMLTLFSKQGTDVNLLTFRIVFGPKQFVSIFIKNHLKN